MDVQVPGTLYLCATPIGNLEDITLRVLRVLQEVDLIAAEDTRRTKKLLSHYDIHTPLTSFHEHNQQEKIQYLLKLLLSGQQIALVADAGMPGISDPGEKLVAVAASHGIPVVPLPGPNAAITALAASGLPASHFCFEGFLPVSTKKRIERLSLLKNETRTIIFYEAPHRLRKTLADLISFLGERRVTIARELTKVHEQVWRGTLTEALEYFEKEVPRGEFTLVIAGADKKEAEREQNELWKQVPISEHVALLESSGITRQRAIREVARLHGIPRQEVYTELVKNNTAGT